MAALAALSPDETADELRLSGQTLRLPLLPYSKLMEGAGQQETEDGSERMRETPSSVCGPQTSPGYLPRTPHPGAPRLGAPNCSLPVAVPGAAAPSDVAYNIRVFPRQISPEA